MKTMTSGKLLKVLAATALIASITGTVLSQEKPSDQEKAKRAAIAQATIAPGAEHKQLEALVGTWDEEIKIWPAPGAKPMILKGRCVNRMVLGGRFLVSEGKGEGPMAFETMQIMGFDTRYKRYTMVGYDSFGTYYVTAAGPYNEEKKAIVMSGEETYPVLGTEKYDMIARIVSPDQYTHEVIFKDETHTRGQGPFKAVEVTCTRVK